MDLVRVDRVKAGGFWEKSERRGGFEEVFVGCETENVFVRGW